MVAGGWDGAAGGECEAWPRGTEPDGWNTGQLCEDVGGDLCDTISNSVVFTCETTPLRWLIPLCNRTCGHCPDGAWWKAIPEPRTDGLKMTLGMADMDFGSDESAACVDMPAGCPNRAFRHPVTSTCRAEVWRWVPPP